ncbi:MAG: hypothetical protein FWG44_03230 [Oscillospiraceae bacterium]|nr:hypothetical protein [Oscillospiraceae bacterium]
MKRIFALFLAIALFVCGCAPPEEPESREAQELVESQNITKKTPPENGQEEKQEEESIQFIKGTYEYKGMIFSGEYHRYDSHETFHIDKNSFLETPGLFLLEFSLSAAMAFISNDIEKLEELFGDKEQYEKYLDYFLDCSDGSDRLTHLSFYYAYMTEKGIALGYIASIASIDYPDDRSMDGYPGIDMDIYMNDKGEWKLWAIANG